MEISAPPITFTEIKDLTPSTTGMGFKLTSAGIVADVEQCNYVVPVNRMFILTDLKMDIVADDNVLSALEYAYIYFLSALSGEAAVQIGSVGLTNLTKNDSYIYDINTSLYMSAGDTISFNVDKPTANEFCMFQGIAIGMEFDAT